MQMPYPTLLQQHLAFLLVLIFLFSISSAGVVSSARKHKTKLRLNAADTEALVGQQYVVPPAESPIDNTKVSSINDALKEKKIGVNGVDAAAASPSPSSSSSSSKLDLRPETYGTPQGGIPRKNSPFRLKQLHEVPSGPNPISNHMPSNRFRNDMPANMPANRLRKDMPVDRLEHDEETLSRRTPPFH